MICCTRADQQASLKESICGPRLPEQFQQHNITNNRSTEHGVATC
jgi:hypothetical protein